MSVKLSEPMAMISSLPIAPSPTWDRGNGLETQPGVEPSGRGDVTPNLPALARILTLQGGEEVRECVKSIDTMPEDLVKNTFKHLYTAFQLLLKL
jgi:hypothetical protein